MRISGIDEYIGGADNVIAFSYIQGEERVLEGRVLDTDNTSPQNLTNFTITAQAQFFMADGTVTSKAANLTNFRANTNEADTDLAVVVTNAADGRFTITIPENFYPHSVTLDAETDIPVGIIYARYDSGTNARINRFIVIIRRGIV